MKQRFYTADAHTDYLYGAANYGFDFGEPKPQQKTNLADFMAGNVALQVFAAWIDTGHEWTYFEQFLHMADAYDVMLKKYADRIVPLSKDFQPESGKIAAVLSVEGGGGLLADNPNMLDVLYERGVRVFSFTWNNSNPFAHGAGRLSFRGLTDRGRTAVQRMNTLNMAIDVSHLNDRGIDDVLDVSSKPIIATHSNCRELCNASRALSRRHISAIAASGGIICVNYYPKQLTDRAQARIEHVADHIERVIDIGGVRCIGLGSDFDGMRTYPSGLTSYADVPKLLEILKKRGVSDEDIAAIAYDNLASFLKKLV